MKDEDIKDEYLIFTILIAVVFCVSGVALAGGASIIVIIETFCGTILSGIVAIIIIRLMNYFEKKKK